MISSSKCSQSGVVALIQSHKSMLIFSNSPSRASASPVLVAHAFMIMLRLPAAVRPVFTERLRESLPLRAEHVLSAVRDVRDGEMNNAQFGQRMRGQGPRWLAIEALFDVHRRRLGFADAHRDADARERFELGGTTFRRPGNRQLGLFEE